MCLSAASGGLCMAQHAPQAQHPLHRCQPVQTLGECSTLCRGTLWHAEAQLHAVTEAVHLQWNTLLHCKLFTTRRLVNEQQRAATTATWESQQA